MDFGIDKFLTMPTMLFGVAVYLIVFMIRRVVETAWKPFTENKYWRDIVLPLLPALLGIALALACYKFPFPEGIKSKSARALYGLVVGFFCSKFYRTAKVLIDRKVPQPDPNAPKEPVVATEDQKDPTEG